MAERPDLDWCVPILARELRGRRIAAVRVDEPVVLRVAVREHFEEGVTSAVFGAVSRRAHFVVMALERGARAPLDLVFAPMLAGRFQLLPAADKRLRDVVLSLSLDDGRELRFRDDVKMGKAYLVPRGETKDVPGLARIGVDVLSPAFTREAFGTLAKTRRDQVRVFLMDKAALDAFGNAYADEVLFEARIHPKTFVRSLDDAALDRLHAAIVTVLRRANEEIARRKPALDVKVRDFLAVRNRHGEPCPRCGATVRRAGVHGHDSFFCPDCQPDGRKSSIVDFRRR